MYSYRQEDWIMRQIEAVAKAIANFFGIEREDYVLEDKDIYTEADLLYKKLNYFIDNKEYLKAEKYLQEHIDYHDLDNLKVAIDFYKKLNRLNDDELTKYHLSKIEIYNNYQAMIDGFYLYL